MRIIIAVMIACATLAEDVPLMNGKTLHGEIVGTVPASIKLKTEAGNMIEIPLSRISPEALTNLPVEVSEPYREIARLQALIREQTETYTQGLNSIREVIESKANQTPVEVSKHVDSSAVIEPAFSSRNLTARLVDDLYGYVTVSWKADVMSRSKARCIVEFRFIDTKGFNVKQGYSQETIIKSGMTTVSGTTMMETPLWKQIKKYDVVVHEMNY